MTPNSMSTTSALPRSADPSGRLSRELRRRRRARECHAGTEATVARLPEPRPEAVTHLPEPRCQACTGAAHECCCGVSSAECRRSCRFRNKRHGGRRKVIAICRQEVVPPGWIEHPTPGSGIMWKTWSPVGPRVRLCCTVQGCARAQCWACLLYTSDAADEEDSVDLGGRRI